jgi:hypothetical protein
MKREWLGWAVAGIVVLLTCTLGAMQQGGAGRYQLVQGWYHIVGQDISEYPTVWRIDTVTGDVVMYQSIVAGNGAGIGWRPVRDFGK